jgi:hypothetical protein
MCYIATPCYAMQILPLICLLWLVLTTTAAQDAPAAAAAADDALRVTASLDTAGPTCCPNTTVIITDTSTPVVLYPGWSYVLGPGSFKMANTTVLASSALCVRGSGINSTQLLAPAGSSRHFNLQGSSRLRLADLTLQGDADRGGQAGGVALAGASTDGNSSSSSAVRAINVRFGSNAQGAVMNTNDTGAALFFRNCEFVDNAAPAGAPGAATAALTTVCQTTFFGTALFR